MDAGYLNRRAKQGLQGRIHFRILPVLHIDAELMRGRHDIGEGAAAGENAARLAFNIRRKRAGSGYGKEGNFGRELLLLFGERSKLSGEVRLLISEPLDLILERSGIGGGGSGSAARIGVGELAGK